MREVANLPYAAAALVGVAVWSLLRLAATYWRRLTLHWQVETRGNKIVYRRGGTTITFENYTHDEVERIMDTWFPGKVDHQEQA